MDLGFIGLVCLLHSQISIHFNCGSWLLFCLLLSGDFPIHMVTKLIPYLDSIDSFQFINTWHKNKLSNNSSSLVQRHNTSLEPNLFLHTLFLLSHKSDGSESGQLPCYLRSHSNRQHPSFMCPALAPHDPHHSNRLSSGHSLASDRIPTAPLSLIIAASQPRPFMHANTDPLTLPHREEPEFLHALVLHGLECASATEQVAIAQVLTCYQVVFELIWNIAGLFGPSPKCPPSHHPNDKYHHRMLHDDTEYYGTWNLPDDFNLVSVCPWSSREWPKIHSSMVC